MTAGPPSEPSRRSGPGLSAGPRRPGPIDPSIRRTWWLLAGSFFVLGLVAVLRVIVERGPLDWLVAVAVLVAAAAAIGHRNAVGGLEQRRRTEAESYASILRGLSRSVSADAIVAAIMDDLVDATGADHVAVVRRNADGTALDATLVTRRPGIPTTTTVLPISDLEGPFGGEPAHRVAVAIEAEGGLAAVLAPVPMPAVVTAIEGTEDGPSFHRTRTPAPAAVGPAVAPEWLVDPPGGLPRTRTARAQAQARRFAARALSEGVALIRDLGVPLPSLARDRLAPPVAEVLGTGLDAVTTDRLAQRVRAAFGLSQTLAAPIRTEQGMIGAIVLSRRDRAAWPDAARRLLFGAVRETATALERANSLREAATQASTDALTGLPNRRYFDEFCGLLARRRRAGDAVAALMIDIDHFKRLNESYGHPVGDVVLRRVAGAIAATVRDEDVPARVGGEEFAVLLRNPGPDVALEVGERVRRAVRSLDLSDQGVGTVSVSVGVANTIGADEPIPDLVERADQALRKAKRAGRDRVIAAS
ncbi:MAG TPA: sensor domain-containing diguanylate cyclase [Candidatus Acidoferrales bacterium]|nr:sensor domain-containing diguanylate cyclase [Candidatus Acidoferrales bacterium]